MSLSHCNSNLLSCVLIPVLVRHAVLRSSNPTCLHPVWIFVFVCVPDPVPVYNLTNPSCQFPPKHPAPSPVLLLSVVQPGVGLFERGEPGVTARPPCRRCQLPLCFKHKHLKHFSCAATRQCMQLKTIGPIWICIPFLRGNVRWNSVILYENNNNPGRREKKNRKNEKKKRSYTRTSDSKLSKHPSEIFHSMQIFSFLLLLFLFLWKMLVWSYANKSPQGGHSTKYAFTQVVGGLREEAGSSPRSFLSDALPHPV